MGLPGRRILSGAPAAAGAIELAVALAGVLGGCAQARAPADSHQLSSPFTGEPVPSPGPVLAVEIANLAPARPQTGLPWPTSSTCCRWRAG